MQKNNVVHCIEVRTRQQSLFGWPEQSIDAAKLKHMYHAAAHFIADHHAEYEVQVDVIAVTIYGQWIAIRWFENVLPFSAR